MEQNKKGSILLPRVVRLSVKQGSLSYSDKDTYFIEKLAHKIYKATPKLG